MPRLALPADELTHDAYPSSTGLSAVDPSWDAPTAADAVPGAAPEALLHAVPTAASPAPATAPVILRRRRPARARTPWGRFVVAVRGLATSHVVESIPTLPLTAATPTVSRKRVEAPSSRFAPAGQQAWPAASAPRPTVGLVTAMPAFAAAASTSGLGSGPGAVSTTGPASAPVSAPGAHLPGTAASPVDTARHTARHTAKYTDMPTDTDPTLRSARWGLARHPRPRMVTVGDYSSPGTPLTDAALTDAALTDAALTDAALSDAVSRERTARESYVLKSRELERAAVERLAHEQQLVERRIRDQLEANQRELHSALDDILEDTIILPRSIAND